MGKGMNWHLSKEDIQMDKYMKMYWTSVIIKELQAKSTMRYYLIPVRVDSIKKGRNSNIGGKREHCFIVCGNVNLFCHSGEQYGGFSKNLEQNSILSRNPASECSSKKKNQILKRYHVLMFIAALFSTPNIWKITCVRLNV